MEKNIIDNKTVYSNGFQRDIHDGKGRFDLLPWNAIWELAKQMEKGSKQYGEHNIDLGCPQHSLIDSAYRHLTEYILGYTDEPHLLLAFWNIAWAVNQEITHPEMQDLPVYLNNNIEG